MHNLLILLAFVVVIVVWLIIRKFAIDWELRAANRSAESGDDSAILSYYAAGNLIAAVNKSKLNDMRYFAYLIMAGGDGVYTDNVSGVLALDLPFNTSAHIIGLSKQHKIERVKFEEFLLSKNMEKVDLEGDFPDYFDIYAAKDQQIEAREILNPETMDFVVKYCQTHFWEINQSELYMAATKADSASDNDSLITDSQQFVAQIKPALLPGEPGAAAVKHDPSYDQLDGPPLPCPICQKPMLKTDNCNWQACSDGEGVFINGSDMIRLRNRQIKIALDPAKAVKHGIITCPNCHNQMSQVNYEETQVLIDSCEHCPFRWLDADEVGKLIART